jgi:hypothetical protein
LSALPKLACDSPAALAVPSFGRRYLRRVMRTTWWRKGVLAGGSRGESGRVMLRKTSSLLRCCIYSDLIFVVGNGGDVSFGYRSAAEDFQNLSSRVVSTRSIEQLNSECECKPDGDYREIINTMLIKWLRMTFYADILLRECRRPRLRSFSVANQKRGITSDGPTAANQMPAPY